MKHAVFFGSSSSSSFDQLAFDSAYYLGRQGYGIVNGGYSGIMASASRGGSEAGTKVTGIALEMFQDDINPWLDEVTWCDSLHLRIDSLIKAGTLFLVFPGGTGTLAELAMVCEYINKRFITPAPVLVHVLWRGVIDTLHAQNMTREPRTGISVFEDHLYFFENLDEIRPHAGHG